MPGVSLIEPIWFRKAFNLTSGSSLSVFCILVYLLKFWCWLSFICLFLVLLWAFSFNFELDDKHLDYIIWLLLLFTFFCEFSEKAIGIGWSSNEASWLLNIY